MQNKTFKKVLLLLVVMVILPPPFKLIDNQLNAQNDAFFYTMSPDDRDGSMGFHINNFSNAGEGGSEGCYIGDFNFASDNVPLGSGVLLLAGSAMAWVLVKDKRRKSINN